MSDGKKITEEMVREAEASGDAVKQAAAAAWRKVQRWGQTGSALEAAKAALADAQAQHNGRVNDLKLAVVSAEQIAAPHIAAVAQAKGAIAKAEEAGAVAVATLRDAVTKAQAEVDHAEREAFQK